MGYLLMSSIHNLMKKRPEWIQKKLFLSKQSGSNK